jgi:hypothetical protein
MNLSDFFIRIIARLQTIVGDALKNEKPFPEFRRVFENEPNDRTPSPAGCNNIELPGELAVPVLIVYVPFFESWNPRQEPFVEKANR